MPGLDPTLAGAFIDNGARHRQFGVTLRPFSLWHLFLLQALDSPFLRRGNVHLHDLRTAVGICRLPFGESKVKRPWLGPLSLHRLVQRNGLYQEVMRFIFYTGDYLSKPEYGVRPSQVRAGSPPVLAAKGAPEILRFAGDIIGWSHWPEDFVWNLPIGKATWYQTCALRAQGVDIDFMTDHDRKFNEAMKQAGLKPKGSLRKDEPKGGKS